VAAHGAVVVRSARVALRRCAGALLRCAAAQPAWPRRRGEARGRRSHGGGAGAPCRTAEIGKLIGAQQANACVSAYSFRQSLSMWSLRASRGGAAIADSANVLKINKESRREYYKFLMLRPGRGNAKRFNLPQMMPGGHRTKKHGDQPMSDTPARKFRLLSP